MLLFVCAPWLAAAAAPGAEAGTFVPRGQAWRVEATAQSDSFMSHDEAADRDAGTNFGPVQTDVSAASNAGVSPSPTSSASSAAAQDVSGLDGSGGSQTTLTGRLATRAGAGGYAAGVSSTSSALSEYAGSFSVTDETPFRLRGIARTSGIMAGRSDAPPNDRVSIVLREAGDGGQVLASYELVRSLLTTGDQVAPFDLRGTLDLAPPGQPYELLVRAESTVATNRFALSAGVTASIDFTLELPEPGTAVLASGAALLLLRRRRSGGRTNRPGPVRRS